MLQDSATLVKTPSVRMMIQHGRSRALTIREVGTRPVERRIAVLGAASYTASRPTYERSNCA